MANAPPTCTADEQISYSAHIIGNYTVTDCIRRMFDTLGATKRKDIADETLKRWAAPGSFIFDVLVHCFWAASIMPLKSDACHARIRQVWLRTSRFWQEKQPWTFKHASFHAPPTMLYNHTCFDDPKWQSWAETHLAKMIFDFLQCLAQECW
jgi:hypothetical protein